MKTNLHLGFQGNCDQAFSFYEKVFGTKRQITMKYGDAPAGMPVPPDSKDLIMHTSLPVGGVLLMGADAPAGRGKPMGGFEISIEEPDQTKLKGLFDALSEGGNVFMPLQKTFWSPLFGMCTDKFGVAWMVGAPGEMPQA